MTDRKEKRRPKGPVEPKGAVFTRPEVVEFILDLAGYTSDAPIEDSRVLEPSFGEGDFLVPIVRRLMDRYALILPPERPKPGVLGNCIRAVELDETYIGKTRSRLEEVMTAAGLSHGDIKTLLEKWLIHGDFLLQDLPFEFDYAVGNPPYVRQELIPAELIKEYRKRFTTIYDRADLYVPFIERSLKALAPGGTLGFICADRWMKNRYGRPLRQLIADGFHLRYYVDMNETEPFLSEVTAYPAVTIIKREPPGPTRMAYRPRLDTDGLHQLVGALRGTKGEAEAEITEVEGIAAESHPWVLEGFDNLALVRRLELELPSIEETGCRIGIGVATGADAVFIAKMEDLDVEEDRKIPLARAKDIQGEEIQWGGFGVINPFKDSGRLVDLTKYPRLGDYFNDHSDALRARRVARDHPEAWYKTIDRIYPELARQPKLLVPDIKAGARIVREKGTLYPHHNLYFITSCRWDLKALQKVLTSGIAALFVSTYSIRMRGGYLRYQAQYLRRIHLPNWEDVSHDIREELTKGSGDPKEAIYELFRIRRREQPVMEEIRKAHA